jgi:AraC family transcriptional regulator
MPTPAGQQLLGNQVIGYFGRLGYSGPSACFVRSSRYAALVSDARLRRSPDGMLTVSEAPRFVWHSSAIGWQGAVFAEILSPASGLVDHVHDQYCLRRTHTAYRRRTGSHASWKWVPNGSWSSWLPGEEQRSEWMGGGRRQFLFVSPSRMEEVLDGQLPRSGGQYSRRPEVNSIVERLFDAMAIDLATGSPAGSLVGDCLVTALCASLFGPPLGAARTGALRPAARRRVLERIDQELDRPLALADLAVDAGLGVRQFCRAFRASTGTSPHQYVLRQRVERARRLIATGRPLAEVALQCGFADQTQLTRVFRRHFGLPPALYRRTLLR